MDIEGTIDQQLINMQLEREEFWEKFRQYLAINNINKNEYNLKIWFDGNIFIGMSCKGYERDILYSRNDDVYEIRQPKNKEVWYWETKDICRAFDIMLDRETPNNYKRLY